MRQLAPIRWWTVATGAGFVLVLDALIFGIMACCPAPKAATQPHGPNCLPPTVIVVPCMTPPPDFDCPSSWPDEDKLGTIIVHGSTVDRFKDCLLRYDEYVHQQFDYCEYIRGMTERRTTK